jgi:putative restriction endonuclease
MNSFNNLIKLSLNENTRFFIFDTKGEGHKYDDQDFNKYSWSPRKYNLVRPGDLFIYRRPSRNNVGQGFYFFGAGQVGPIYTIGHDMIQAQIINPLVFDNYLYSIDLLNFKWTFKEKNRDDWQYFFNQYGMMEINRQDFIALINLQANTKRELDLIYDQIDKELEVNLYQQIHNHHYRVEDKTITQKVRGSAQAIFAKEVKGNYSNRCCITGINTQRLLIASHIIPWSEDEDNRLNPANGLCLSPLFDKAFDLGLITITTNKKVKISNTIQKDKYLFEYFSDFDGLKINTRVPIPPKEEFLQWHNQNTFEQIIK